MAQKTVVTVVCDLPHDGEVEGTETVSFAFDGAAWRRRPRGLVSYPRVDRARPPSSRVPR